jgi:dihydroxyacid dehydratase/phosphogluconate dehydratase
MRARIDSGDLPVDENSVLVMKNGGPKGAPGMPEWGHIPMPAKLLKRRIDDIVRISDARMSGTSFGTVVLHVAPESAVGGPLAIVEDGDEILLDVPSRRLEVNLPAGEIERRLTSFRPVRAAHERGYARLFLDHVQQANLGCDFDFLRHVGQVGNLRPIVNRPSSSTIEP